MVKHNSAEIADTNWVKGEKLYYERAKIALPYLVRQAKAGQTIYYSDLAREIDIPNPRNLNYVLGAIGDVLVHLSEHLDQKIPPIQCVVINKKDNLPGEGIGWFIKTSDFNKLNKTQKHKIINANLIEIFTYPYWDWILEKLGLQPIDINLGKELQLAKLYGGGGESEAHKKFKKFIAQNPIMVGVNVKASNVIEYHLPSSDTIDVLFVYQSKKIGVEVKSFISNTSDILRGIFQCVKYKHLLEAEQIFNNEVVNSRVILALEGPLPNELIIVKNLLGIEVIDNLGKNY